MKKIIHFVSIFVITGCTTLSGVYVLSAYDSEGKLLTGDRNLMAIGSAVYTAIGGICIAYPKSKIIIKDTKTREELTGVSPHQCR